MDIQKELAFVSFFKATALFIPYDTREWKKDQTTLLFDSRNATRVPSSCPTWMATLAARLSASSPFIGILGGGPRLHYCRRTLRRAACSPATHGTKVEDLTPQLERHKVNDAYKRTTVQNHGMQSRGSPGSSWNATLRPRPHLTASTVELGAARLLTLPDSNPVGRLTRKVGSKNCTKHQMSLHFAYHSPRSLLLSLKGDLEVFDPAKLGPCPHPHISSYIASLKEAENIFVTNLNFAQILSDPRRQMACSDGSLIPPQGVGSDVDHMVYEAGLVGVKLVVEAVHQQLTPKNSLLYILIDNQPAIYTPTQQP
ncbi:hypothetical protein CROQUDRAFT_92451 [Cronartium quercuum f. sp. fusiforme G11]|uniref:Uncharacterized protein n=1 Tax=Cronartium quercuum f. sp. fusiforme G11 TaxID=708437 RepID=A0A9P6NNA3_9BASI|nr:hypothetical protein CROQUDRAFT_92451 [Cronartium quercuum f. sp. fusiforme G11]